MGPTNEQKIRNAEIMFGTGSGQHLAAIAKYGRPDVCYPPSHAKFCDCDLDTGD